MIRRSQEPSGGHSGPLFSDVSSPKNRRPGLAWRPLAVSVAALLIGWMLYLSPLVSVVDNRLLEWRMGATALTASGEIVFVAIDPRSLREVGSWPWSRSVHADILDRLVAAGARDVFFDIDFAFPSDVEGDTQFASALERAGGATLLATFAQAERIGASSTLSYNLPYAPFREWSWTASVNVDSDRDGLIRTYPSGLQNDGQFTPSAAILLAGGAIDEGTQFLINYSISPADIPSLSAVDVARGEFQADMVRGRSVIIGAGAIELGDHFAVPLHQVIPGALIHALAAETIILDATISWARADVLAAMLAVLVLWMGRVTWRSPWRFVSVTGLVVIGVEALALVVFQATFVSLPTAFIHPALLAHTLLTLANSLDFSKLLLSRKDIQIRNSQALLEHLFKESSDGVVIVGPGGETLLHSRSAQAMFGTNEVGDISLPTEVVNRALKMQAETGHNLAEAELGTVILPGENGPRHIEYLVSPSSFHDLELGTHTTAAKQIAAISARDVTDLKRQEREIAYLSTHDERTGALRRLPFLELFRLRLETSAPTAVFALKLHGLKAINLTFGRDVSDDVLRGVVERLEKLEMGLSAIARLDGNSFAFFIEGVSNRRDFTSMARSIRATVTKFYDLADVAAQIEASIGYVEVGLENTLSAEQLLSRAEDALDAGTSGSMSGVFAYDPSVAEQRARVRAVERALPGSVERGELYVVYQTQHRLEDGALIGLEALVRWKNPDLGQVFPDEFIPIAESNGFISELGRFVLHKAVQDATSLPEEVTMAVNVSSVQFRNGDLLSDVQNALAQSGLPPERLCLELTESVLLTEDNDTMETMQDIAMAGVTWAMDDFGTGFSSMAYLSSLPLEKVKLDRSFTMALHTDPSARVILRSVKALCDGLGIGLLCEGVETDEHRNILMEEGCLEGQGYYYGRPVPLSDIVRPNHELQSGGAVA